jgi:hypothetical protein
MIAVKKLNRMRRTSQIACMRKEKLYRMLMSKVL